MSFFNKLKRAFGFNSDGEDLDEVVDYDLSKSPFSNPFRRNDSTRHDLYDTTDEQHDEPAVPVPVPQPKRVEVKQQRIPADTPAQDLPEPKAEPASPAPDHSALIDAVIVLINDSLPPMMKQYINADTQRNDVVKALQPHLAKATETTDQDLKLRLKQSDMLRRAAQNRANDLSQRITELEGENEKLELERKSLESHMKVMQVSLLNATPAQDGNQPGAEDLRKEIEQRDNAIATLQEQLNEANENLKIAEHIEKRIQEMEQHKQQRDNETRKLRERIAQLENETKNIDSLKAQCQLALEENTRLKKEIDDMMRKTLETNNKHNRRDIELANRINDLKAQLASAAKLSEGYKDSLDEHINAVEQLRNELNEALETRTSALRKLQDTEEKLDELTHAHTAATQRIEQLTTMLEQAKAAKHAAMPQLEDEDATIIEPIAENEVVTEPEAIIEPIGEAFVAEPEAEPIVLEAEPEPVVSQPEAVAEPVVSEAEPVAESQSLSATITLDDIDDADWLIPVEPEPAPEPEPEPEPAPKPKTDPRQLSLW